MSGSNTQQIVENLNAGWRNTVCDALNLSRDTFQLAQGTLGLQTTDSSGLFAMADAVPPPSTVGYYDSTTMNKRSSAYLNLLDALLPENNPQALKQALGDMYTAWITWKAGNKPETGEDTLAYFKRWEMQAPIDPGQGARAENAIIMAQTTALTKAANAYTNPANSLMFTASDGTSYTLYRYTKTIQDAQAAINGGGPAKINFDSRSMDTSSNTLFVNGAASGFYSIFSAGASGSFDQENAKAVGSRITIEGHIGKVATLSSGPGNWYSSEEVSRAFTGKGNAQIWDPNASAGNWDAFFGQPNGSLARYVSQLVLVSDYKITVTSTASYSQSEYEKIKAEAHVGVWPFFSADGSATQETSLTLNSDSSLSVTHSLGKGLIQIRGVTVQPQGQSK